MNRTPMGRQLDFDLKYKMNNNDFIKFIEKEKKKTIDKSIQMWYNDYRK